MRKRREYDDDDGRTIAPMNIDGMPWHTEGKIEQPPGEPYRASREESRAAAWGAVMAGLVIALVFAVVFGLFIFLLDRLWFR